MAESLIIDKNMFFSEEDFQTIESYCPTEGWKDAVVYSRIKHHEVKAPESRLAEKVHEKRKDVLKKLKSIVLRNLLTELKKDKDFQYVWCRSYHTEWIRYKEGMFFNKHQDFEKYNCNGLIPYVCIIGLEDTLQGGETIVEERILTGSTSKNGLIFFPGNVMHEGTLVKKGEKKCLKMEFLVFRDNESNFIRISDEQNKWKSFWSKKELEIVENFISSNSSVVFTSSDIARNLYNIMHGISDPKFHHHVQDLNSIFPSKDLHCLHEIFSVIEFLKKDKKGVIMGNNSDAWTFLNTWTSLPSNCTLKVVLWTKKYKKDQYELGKIFNKSGEETSFNNSNYVDFMMLKWDIIKRFVSENDLETYSTTDFILKTGTTMTPISHDKLVRILEKTLPSDETIQPEHRKGTVTVTETELCNDAESGLDTISYQQYVSFYMQVRWVLIRF